MCIELPISEMLMRLHMFFNYKEMNAICRLSIAHSSSRNILMIASPDDQYADAMEKLVGDWMGAL